MEIFQTDKTTRVPTCQATVARWINSSRWLLEGAHFNSVGVDSGLTSLLEHLECRVREILRNGKRMYGLSPSCKVVVVGLGLAACRRWENV